MLWKVDNRYPPPWEGITWVLELLPRYPQKAIESVQHYLHAHFFLLPDWRINGLVDAISVIRAKFIGLPETNIEKVDFLLELTSREFEHLIESLYYHMSYNTTLTPATRDGGHDVIATRDRTGRRETVSVECKLYTQPVGVEHVRNLRGVISYNGSNKGVLFTSNEFTLDAQMLARKDHIVELIYSRSMRLQVPFS